MKIGDTIRLIGKTRRGKNKIAQHGDTWTVIRIGNNVACCDGGIGVFLENGKGDARWVALPDDPDFDIDDPDITHTA